MKCVITGGAGFIGSHLATYLLSLDHSVTVLDNYSTGRPENLDHVRHRVKLVECDVGYWGEWSKEFDDVDWVFHLAALADIVPSIQKPKEYFVANVDGTLNVLDVVLLVGIILG